MCDLIWARELDEGNYWCSMSSMYRLAYQAQQSRERRRLATHPAKTKPELLADGPSQVWSWDITKLRGPSRGVWYHLCVLIDIDDRPPTRRATATPVQPKRPNKLNPTGRQLSLSRPAARYRYR